MRSALVVSCLLLTACSSSDYQGHGVSWTMPRGVSLEKDTTTEATFSGGVTLRTIPSLGAPDEAHLVAIRAGVMPEGFSVITAKVGTAPAGAVVRVSASRGDQRLLAYYLELPTGALVLSLTGPAAVISSRENHFDLSLSSLRVAH